MAGYYDPKRYQQYNAPRTQYGVSSYQTMTNYQQGWQVPTASQYGFAPQPYNGLGPTLAPGVEVGEILETPPDALPDAIARIGAMNTRPPVAHSSHLRNIQTGLILPWNSMLAEQRDIMVPCDQYGNTNPEAWQKTVVPDADPNEQEKLYWQARQSIVEQAMQMTEKYRQDPTQGTIPTNENPIPENTVPFDALDARRDTFEQPLFTPQTLVSEEEAEEMKKAAVEPETPSAQEEAPAPDVSGNLDDVAKLCDMLGA